MTNEKRIGPRALPEPKPVNRFVVGAEENDSLYHLHACEKCACFDEGECLSAFFCLPSEDARGFESLFRGVLP